MKPIRDLAYVNAHAEIRTGQEAKKIGNTGKARVCARRGCGIAIEYWLQHHPEKNWGESAISMLTQLQRDQTIPSKICEAAERLTKKVDQNFKTGVEEDPIKDGEMIIEYFLNYQQYN
jgi:hypothetical protein